MQANFDKATARQRIRNAAAYMAAPNHYNRAVTNFGGYHDVDRATPTTGYAQQNYQPAYRDNDAPHQPDVYRAENLPAADTNSRAFEDLDLQPLEGGDQTTAQPGTPPANLTNNNTTTAVPKQEPETRLQAGMPQPADAQLLEPPVMRRIIHLATTRTGNAAPFGRAQPNLDGQGLRYGIGRFTQASGQLGRLLKLFNERDAEQFSRIFGPDSTFPDADPAALLTVTNAPDAAPGTPEEQIPRLQPVNGKTLWDPAWIQRFKTAAQHEPFQDMQFRMAAECYLLPILPFARNLGLATERGLAILTERAIQLGVERMREFIIAAAGPINTDALRHAALELVAADPNHATLADFQRSAGIEEPPGQFGPLSHAALVAAVRAINGESPTLPSPEMMLDQIAQATARSELPGLVSEIKNNPDLNDAPLSEATPVME